MSTEVAATQRTLARPAAARSGVGVGRLVRAVAFNAALILVAFFALFPIVWLLLGSLQTIQELYGSVTLIPRVPQLANYAKAWNDGHFSTYIPNSFLYSTTVVAGVLLIASMAGYALA